MGAPKKYHDENRVESIVTYFRSGPTLRTSILVYMGIMYDDRGLKWKNINKHGGRSLQNEVQPSFISTRR